MLLERLDRLEQRLEAMEAKQARRRRRRWLRPGRAASANPRLRPPAAPAPSPARRPYIAQPRPSPRPVNHRQPWAPRRPLRKSTRCWRRSRMHWDQVRGKALGDSDSAQQASGGAGHARSATRSAGSPGSNLTRRAQHPRGDELGGLHLDEREHAQRDTALDTKFFTPEVRFDTNFMQILQSPEGPYDGWRHGVVPLRRISDGAGQRGRQFPLA